eukprot:CAMPEP_0114239096 /NCGR_PEP_ID=MMETSP0058-20121206/8268_1 /TAXON_ID=36894 /ORGANISM="Pyramimonas parkeae, CCMP726" /LENGTH=386 /DNA_ID=CAMNT_0001351235 /DNA_START=281 /DNA_END=1441 /DNA_ORIENTATION=-
MEHKLVACEGNHSTSIRNCEDIEQVPPSGVEHLIHAPYLYLWGRPVILVCLVCVILMGIPHMRELQTAGAQAAKERDLLYPPYQFALTFVLARLPVIVCSLCFVKINFPRISRVVTFLQVVYQAIVMQTFSQLLLFYTGGWKNLITSISDSKRNIWGPTRPPCCWCSMCYMCKCCKPAIASQFHLKRINFFLLQFLILGPSLSALTLVTDDSFASSLLLLSAGTGNYALYVQMELVSEVLQDYNITKKFGCIQLSLMATSVITTIMKIVNAVDFRIDYHYKCNYYSPIVVAEAMGAIVTALLMIIIADGTRINFLISELTGMGGEKARLRNTGAPGKISECHDVEVACTQGVAGTDMAPASVVEAPVVKVYFSPSISVTLEVTDTC